MAETFGQNSFSHRHPNYKMDKSKAAIAKWDVILALPLLVSFFTLPGHLEATRT